MTHLLRHCHASTIFLANPTTDGGADIAGVKASKWKDRPCCSESEDTRILGSDAHCIVFNSLGVREGDK